MKFFTFVLGGFIGYLTGRIAHNFLTGYASGIAGEGLFKAVNGITLKESIERGFNTNKPTKLEQVVIDTYNTVDSEFRGSYFVRSIRNYREATGLGLKESKDAVEAICHKYGLSTSVSSTYYDR